MSGQAHRAEVYEGILPLLLAKRPAWVDYWSVYDAVRLAADDWPDEPGILRVLGALVAQGLVDQKGPGRGQDPRFALWRARG